MEYWVNHPFQGQLKLVHDWRYLFDNSEGAVTFGGKFYSLIGEGKVLSFKPHLFVDVILCWGC